MTDAPTPITTSEAPVSFRRFVRSQGSTLESLDPEALVASMVAWYETVRVADALGVDDDGDMLLFQYGVFDFGEGPSFHYDLTRQLTVDGSGDDGICQLSVTLHYPVSDPADALGRGSRWCASPSQSGEFRDFVANHPATEFARKAPITNRTLTWNRT